MDSSPVINSISDLQQLVISGYADWESLGYIRVTERDNLLLFNYTHAAQFAGEWNFFERISRGLIINKVTGEIVARPFDKFFNWAERGRKPPYDAYMTELTMKVDGSLGILYRDGAAFKIATRGSFDSEQAIWATNFVQRHCDFSGLPEELTLLFEIVYPENRVVIDYGGKEALILLAARNRFTGEYLPYYPDLFELADWHGLDLVPSGTLSTPTQLLEMLGELSVNHEGWVTVFSDGSRWKFKGDAYVEAHRAISNLSFKNALKAYRNGTVEFVKQALPDEFHDEFNGYLRRIEFKLKEIIARVKLAYGVAPKESRKDFALWVNSNHPDLSSYLFAHHDGRDLEPIILQREFRNES